MPNTPVTAPTAGPGSDRLALGAEVIRGAGPGSNPTTGCYCSCACFEAEPSGYGQCNCAVCTCYTCFDAE